MTPPSYFDVEYDINAWMHDAPPVDKRIARQEWQALHDVYTKLLGWQVDLIDPVPHLPDMVFATDSCLVIGGRVLLSSFRYPERRPETAEYEKWLRAHGSSDLKQATRFFEGGDNLVCGELILAGHGFRSDAAAADELHAYFGRQVVPLKLINPLLYHLDTCVAVLSSDTVAVHMDGLDTASQQRLRETIPNIIEATLDEALSFSLNALSDGHTVITNDESPSLAQKYRAAGFTVITTPISEFKKSGGGVHCMTLELDL